MILQCIPNTFGTHDDSWWLMLMPSWIEETVGALLAYIGVYLAIYSIQSHLESTRLQTCSYLLLRMPGKTRVTRHQHMKPTTNREKREALRTKCTRTSLASPSPASDAMPNTMAMTSRSSIQKWPGWVISEAKQMGSEAVVGHGTPMGCCGISWPMVIS